MSPSAYELLREAKILRNKKRLVELGLDQPIIQGRGSGTRPHKKPALAKSTVSSSVAESTVVSVRRSSRLGKLGSSRLEKLSVSNEVISLRRSSRLEKLSVSNAGNGDKVRKRKLNKSVDELLTNRSSRNLIKDKKRQILNVPSISIDDTVHPQELVRVSAERRKSREIMIDSDRILAQALGKYASEKMGKAAVVEFASLNDNVSFNKYSGVLEWSNSLFLWVNLGGPNTFTENKMTWFGGSRMHDESEVIKRLIKARKAQKCDDSSESVLLWVRFMDGSKAQPYICLGRLAYVHHSPGTHPLEFEFELMDYKTLRESCPLLKHIPNMLLSKVV